MPILNQVLYTAAAVAIGLYIGTRIYFDLKKRRGQVTPKKKKPKKKIRILIDTINENLEDEDEE